MREGLSPANAWAGSLGFIHNTFFEIMVSISTAMKIVAYWDELEEEDHISIYSQLGFIAILTAYLIYFLYFAIFKSGKLAQLR